MSFRRKCVYAAAVLCCQLACVGASASSAPQRVDEAQVPSLEQMRHRFHLLSEQLKPEFMQNMTLLSRHRVAALEGLGCQEERTLPAGAEFEPGKLDGAITLFACEDGSYGVLEVHEVTRSATRTRGLSASALNDRIGDTRVVARHSVTASGRSGHSYTWQDASGAIFSLALTDQAPRDAAGGAAAPDAEGRAKALAARLGNIGSGRQTAP